MTTPTPTPIADTSHHIITVINDASTNVQYVPTKQIDVRKVTSWSYWTDDGTTWYVKLSIPGQLIPQVVPDAGVEGTGWFDTKTASLANGG